MGKASAPSSPAVAPFTLKREESGVTHSGRAFDAARVLLVHMPMADPVMPNLGIEVLAERLRAAGIGCDSFYGSLRLPPACSTELMHGMAGYGLFTPAYFELDVDSYVEEAAACIALGTEAAPYEPTFVNVAAELYGGIAAAEICLERCLAEIPVAAYDLIGFSIIFDTQKIPSLALAKALKTREPHLRIMLGGTGCDGEMAEALIEHFPEVDAILRGDAEEMIVSFVKELRSGIKRVDRLPPNAAVRHLTAARPPVNGKLASLARRDTPDYSSFIEQWNRSPYRDRQLTLLFEASRGCWWGEKHHCRFCGIRTVADGYRQREAEAVFDEIVSLHRRYRPDLLYATDAILSRDHMRSLLPALAERQRYCDDPLRLFFEIKSTVTQQDAALLAAAGVVAVQPGIESFSDNMLRNTDKGAVGIRQVAALKWLGTYSIDTIYGLLIGAPGETAADIAELIEVIGSMHHLQPPAGVNPLALHRFSPYWNDPEHWNIRNIRAYEAQRIAFRAPEPLLQRLCYELAFDSDPRCDADLQPLYDRLRSAVLEWQIAFAQGCALNLVGAAEAPMIIRRRGANADARLLDPDEYAIYRAVAHPVSLARAAEVAAIASAQTAAILAQLREEGLVLSMSGLWLALAQPSGVDAWTDAGLSTAAPSSSHPALFSTEKSHGLAAAATTDRARY